MLQVERCQVEIADLRKRLNQYESLATENSAQVNFNSSVWILTLLYIVKVVGRILSFEIRFEGSSIHLKHAHGKECLENPRDG